MKNRKTLIDKIRLRIARKRAEVFLRDDFADLGGYDQVGRSLQQLLREGVLLRIGYGLYARAVTYPLTGEPVPVKPLPSLAREALQRLGVPVVPTLMDAAYRDDLSTQVPTDDVSG